ncbi:13695_t:CDS:2 [Ambispora leptoticha]|uniref:13695_t:CDS:1 n=1 Tax=Ambispora leptoticha TaxID=144679 RepID=A0A9N9G4E5_9GLOM|nr:13695_t:CDS:2 [Ambispora leptoticha]
MLALSSAKYCNYSILIFLLLITHLSSTLEALPLQHNIERFDINEFGIFEDHSFIPTFIEPQPEQKKIKNRDSTSYFFTQPIDHNDQSQGQFNQRYFVNSTFYKPGGPVFLYVGGESAIMTSTVEYSEASELAASLNGFLVIAEHRYHGESLPNIPNMKSENLKFLNTEQALQDFANFIINAPSSSSSPLNVISKDSKWISIGGSYGGNLAAWLREKFPNLIFAAYASSAPVKAELNFFQYDQAIANRLPCRDLVGESIEYIDSILTSGNRSAIDDLKKQFGLDAIQDDKDFASALNDPFIPMVQYYFPPTSSSEQDSIKMFCDAFTNSPDQSPKGLTAVYANGMKYFLQIQGYTNTDKILKVYATNKLSTDLGENQDETAWMWQYCNEFGYYQTAPQPPSLRLRSILIDADYYQSRCNFLWPDIPNSPDVDRINNAYGSTNAIISRVIYVNGDGDPWFPLTVSSNDANRKSTPNTPILVVKGGAHVTDLRPPTSVDWDSLKQARSDARNYLKTWLNIN